VSTRIKADILVKAATAEWNYHPRILEHATALQEAAYKLS